MLPLDSPEVETKKRYLYHWAFYSFIGVPSSFVMLIILTLFDNGYWVSRFNLSGIPLYTMALWTTLGFIGLGILLSMISLVKKEPWFSLKYVAVIGNGIFALLLLGIGALYLLQTF